MKQEKNGGYKGVLILENNQPSIKVFYLPTDAQ
jgi:hypothetical protein